MKKNPFAKAEFKSHTPILATELKFGKSKERVVASNGELNASSKADLVNQISKLIAIASSNGGQEIVTEAQAVERQEMTKLHKEMVHAAFNSAEAHRELGEVLADELYQAANREGFMRRFLSRQDLSQGQFPTVRMRMKNVVATVAGAPSMVTHQLIRDNLYTPPEFYITTRPFVEQREIVQSQGDVLEEKYIEGLEAIMVGEDRTWYMMANSTVSIANNLTTVVGTLSPTSLANVRNQVTRWNIPAANLLIANDLWSDIVGDTGFSGVIDPVSKHELLLSGQLGIILGMNVISDAFRHPQHKVVSQGEFFVIGDAINHGQYTDRGGVDSSPTDGALEKNPRSWLVDD